MCWELLFSLALPVYVIIATDMRFVAPIALACVLLSEWTQWPPLRHMAMFALGVALAKRLTDNGRETMRDVVAVPLALCGIVLVCQSGFGLLPGIVAQPLAVCGCLILVVVALTCNVVSDLLSTPPVRWLGRISFSLYLTHLPIRDWIVPYIPVQVYCARWFCLHCAFWWRRRSILPWNGLLPDCQGGWERRKGKPDVFRLRMALWAESPVCMNVD